MKTEEDKLEQAEVELNDAQTKLEQCDLAYKQARAQVEIKYSLDKFAEELEQFEFELAHFHAGYKRRLLKCETAEDVERARAAFNKVKVNMYLSD